MYYVMFITHFESNNFMIYDRSVSVLMMSLIKLQSGQTPLLVAANKGHTQTVDLLIQKGADVNKAEKVSLYRLRHHIIRACSFQNTLLHIYIWYLGIKFKISNGWYENWMSCIAFIWIRARSVWCYLILLEWSWRYLRFRSCWFLRPKFRIAHTKDDTRSISLCKYT